MEDKKDEVTVLNADIEQSQNEENEQKNKEQKQQDNDDKKKTLKTVFTTIICTLLFIIILLLLSGMKFSKKYFKDKFKRVVCNFLFKNSGASASLF